MNTPETPVIVESLTDITEGKFKIDQVLGLFHLGIAVWDQNANLVYLSSHLRELLDVRESKFSPDFGMDRLLKNSDDIRCRRLIKRYISVFGMHFLDIALQPVENSNGLLLGYLSVCQDVTRFQLKKIETEIRGKLEGMNLNQKQIQILEMLVKGESNKGIANAINLSEQGVKYHVGNLLERFGSRNRLELRSKLYELLKSG